MGDKTSELEQIEALARLLFGLRYAAYYWADAGEPEREQYRSDAKAIIDAGWRKEADRG